MSELVEVNIQGQIYRLRTDAESRSEYLREVASYVDSEMRGLVRQSQGASHDRVAVMAAIRIADRLFQQRQKVTDGVESFEEKVGKLIESSDQLLKG
ncbi:MAG: cell division protein ZapA [Magnetococcales bacterium]|nr:cell division protein ZapA [Magnetococcales bacterium]